MAEVSAEARVFTGPAFWQVHERMLAPQIIDIGTPWLAQAA